MGFSSSSSSSSLIQYAGKKNAAVFGVACLAWVLLLFVYHHPRTTSITSSSSSLQITRLRTKASSATRVRHERLSGNLTLADFSGTRLPHCVNFQIRGVHGILTSSQAQQYFAVRQQRQQEEEKAQSSFSSLPLGIVSVEDPTNFVSLSKGYFHFFHFLEFAVIAFAELYQLSSQWSAAAPETARGQSSSSSPLAVQWWYAPLLTQTELCGAAHGMNCVVLQTLWRTARAVYGLESNPPALQGQHEAYRGVLHKRAKVDDNVFVPLPPNEAMARHQSMLDQVDVLLYMDRVQCKREQRHRIHKIWTNYLDTFPAQAWHDTIQKAVAQPGVALSSSSVSNDIPSVPVSSTSSENTTTTYSDNNDKDDNNKNLVVAYIDRQRTDRKIPNAFHSWLLQYLRHQPGVALQHVRMERYSALQQLQLATQWDMIVGVHGNGLSHQLWMRPSSSYVLEMYWEFPFQYDYASAAQLLHHTYRGVYNGQLLNGTRIAHRDPTMLQYGRTVAKATAPPQESHWNWTASQQAVQDFVEQALRERGIVTTSLLDQ